MAITTAELSLRAAETAKKIALRREKAQLRYAIKLTKISRYESKQQKKLNCALDKAGCTADQLPPPVFKKLYSLGEELINAISHGLGACLGLAATVLMIIKAVPAGAVAVAAASLYGLSIFFLFFMSMMYHAIHARRAKAVFRIFDHCAIFILIAGTYTPITLLLLHAYTIGYIIFCSVWALAALGVVLNAVSLEKSKLFSLIAYVLMGWSVLLGIKPILETLAPAGLWLLLGGGALYTLGMVLYNIKKRYLHSVWHFFVLGGSVLHFFTIYLYVLK